MKKYLCVFAFSLFFLQAIFAQFPAATNLTTLSITTNTREKPQSKVWFHDGKHWTVQSDTLGAHVWRLDGTTWTRILTIHNKENRRADCKVDGNLVHIFLFRPGESDLVSIEYIAANSTYQLWSGRTTTIRVPTSNDSETATIDLDSTGRMWMATDDDQNIFVRYSDPPYITWSNPITITSNIDSDDIGAVVAFPTMNKIGVFWSNQVTKRWGFKMHDDGTDPNSWSADELPASQSAINNVGHGMADDHLNLKVASDGTLYCAIKTGYDTPGYPRIALLVRRPTGTWDNLYGVSEIGTRGIVVVNEQTGKIRVIYASNEDGGDILYKESAISPVSFGNQHTLIFGNYNNPTSIKSNYNSEVVILASTSDDAVGVLATDNGTPPPPLPDVPVLDLPVNGATAVNNPPTLTWQAAANAASYHLQVSTSPNFSTRIVDSTYLLNLQLTTILLSYSTQYYWRVRAHNTSGFSNWSATGNFTTQPEPIIIPDVPALNLPGNNATGMDISPTLSWNAAANATYYRLQVSTTANFASLVSDVSNLSSLSLRLSGLGHSSQYFWRIKAYSHNGESAWSSNWNFTTEAAPPSLPAVPVLVSPTDSTTGANLALTLSWDSAAQASTYQVQVATSADFLTPVYDVNEIAGQTLPISNLTYTTTYFWRVRAHNSLGSGNWSAVRSFTTMQQPSSLVGHWQMDDTTGTNLTDVSGYANHATTFGSPVHVTGVIGHALHLNGTNQYATVPSSSSLSPGNAITLAAWIKPERSGLRQVVLKKGITEDGYEFSVTGSRKITFRYNQETASAYQIISSGLHPIDGQTWMHIAATFDGTTARVYLDGILDKSVTFTAAPAIASNSQPLSIGAQSNGSSRLQGAIDDVRIYNTALTAAEISELATLSSARMAAVQQPQQLKPVLQANPNPFYGSATINFTVPATGEYTVILYNMAGRAVKLLQQGKAEEGDELSVLVDGSKLVHGLYMVRLQTGQTSQSLKLMRLQ